MEKTKKASSNEYFVIDFGRIMKYLWRKVWIIILVSILTAGIGFAYCTFAIAPTYSSSIMLYVNNTSFSVNDLGFSISSSEISAAQSLVKTYTVLLKNRTTLERVIKETGLNYTYGQVYAMIEAKPVQETEIMGITVTCEDPYHAEKIANAIAVVLPKRVAEIVEGSSMEVVDSARVNVNKVAPSTTKYTAVGFFVGAVISMGIFIIIAIMDNTIHDDEYITDTYNYPILAKIPDLMGDSGKKYGYYYKYKSVPSSDSNK